ncbi:DnaJ domain-containing protein [Marinobacter sp. M1N3S26]|uniref:DnaJ domain-containing protein n=1 Tax=Marinobacter sp. M1N3S26 TaxID=3382299 RepID=UPI00387B5EAD
MNPWQVLGVEPGSDRRTIKRAYTRLVKEVHPEDHPDEFMELRQAYEWALKTLDAPARPMAFTVEPENTGFEPPEPSDWDSQGSASSADTRQASPVIEDTWSVTLPEAESPVVPITDTWSDPEPDGADRQSADAWNEPPPRLVEDEVQDRQETLNRLVSAMARLLDDPDHRNDLARWEPLLMAPELNDFQSSSAVSSWLLPQVIRVLQSGQVECPFEPGVLIRFDDRFQWSSDHSGTMPVIEDQMLRLCLLIEAARALGGRSRARLGWAWLAETLFGVSGRLSRIECLLGYGVALGVLGLLTALSITTAMPDHSGLAAVAVMLLMLYSTISLAIKRVRDAGINLALAFVVGAILPGSWLVFLLAAPKHNDKVPDPRLKYSQVFDRTYREHYVAEGKRSLPARLRERLSGIHPGIYLTLAGLWAATAVLLSL